MRPLKFKTISKEQPSRDGLFHQWGTEILEATDSVTQYSVGIVEDENGHIHNVYPEFIQFTDKPKTINNEN